MPGLFASEERESELCGSPVHSAAYDFIIAGAFQLLTHFWLRPRMRQLLRLQLPATRLVGGLLSVAALPQFFCRHHVWWCCV